jgi:hypothetical protein
MKIVIYLISDLCLKLLLKKAGAVGSRFFALMITSLPAFCLCKRKTFFLVLYNL